MTDVFEDLRPVVEQAAAFASEWPEPFQPRAFDLALEHLRRGTPTEATGPVSAPRATGGRSFTALAKEVGVTPDALARVVEIADDGAIVIAGRFNDAAKADRQVKYSVVYCLIRDRMTGKMDTSIDDLRTLCQEQGSYDAGNFTKYFRSARHLLHEAGTASARTYRLSNQGITEAKALLKQLAEA